MKFNKNTYQTLLKELNSKQDKEYQKFIKEFQVKGVKIDEL